MISFLTYSSLILGSWNESYPGIEIPPNIHAYNQIDQYKITTTGNFYVLHVVFTTIVETQDNGGAICMEKVTKLLIESSCFIKCHAMYRGGAIYFDNTEGISFLKKVCSTGSYSSTSGSNFCYISTKNSDQCTNCIEHTTITYLKSDQMTNTNLYNSGIIIFKNDNITKNECPRFSSVQFSPSINSSVSYSTFENNTSNFETLYFSNDKTHDMNTCNFIGNAAKPDNAIIYIWSSLNILNSCLIENTNPMFNFYGKCNCTIINCTIDNTNKNGGGNIIVDNIPHESFINNLDNYECFSMSTSTKMFSCPTFKIRQYIYNMNKYRGISILARF